MGIIIKFVLTAMKEKKGRTTLIILAIALSSALFFSSNAISKTMESSFLQRMTKYYGNADIIIHPDGRTNDAPLFTYHLKEFIDDFSFIISSIEQTAVFKPARNESVRIDLRGLNYEDMKVFSEVYIKEETNLFPFEGKKIILSEDLLTKYNLQIGDYIDLEMNGTKYKYRISASASLTGIFAPEGGGSYTAVVPLKGLDSIFDMRGKSGIIYLKAKNPAMKMELIEKITSKFTRFTVRETINNAELAEYTSGISTPFLFMTLLVLVMSIFIIYTSFKVITTERLPVIGTFRSIGATKKMTDFVLIMESVIYGIAGGIIGIVLGFVILFLMSLAMSKNYWDNTTNVIKMDFSMVHLLTSFLLAVLISFISSIIPIIKVSKIPVKEIVLNKVENKVKKSKIRLFLAIFLALLTVVVPYFAPRGAAVFLNGLCIITAIVSVILLIPYITYGFTKIFELLYDNVFGNIAIIAVKNLRENKNILNNIALLAISISSVLMINTVSFSVVEELTGFYKNADFNLWMWIYNGNKNTLSSLSVVPGVTDSYGVSAAYNTEVKGKKKSINLIHGVDEGYVKYWKVEIPREYFLEIEQSRSILLANTLREKLGIKKIGETIILKTTRGEKKYKVAGFFYSMRWGGNFALVGRRYMRLDMGGNEYEEIYIKASGDIGKVEEEIKKKFSRFNPWINQVPVMQETELKSNEQMFIILKGFSAVTLIIGIFGVMNNLLISFLERKRSLAIFRSVGMSKTQITAMVFIEALTGGIMGGIIGIGTGALLINTVKYVLKAIDLAIPMHYNANLFLYSFFVGVIIYLISSIGPAVKSSKLNIIEAIKYE